MKTFQVLDRNQDVHQDYLLEASAGTGKTFSIENLVVRLLIETDFPYTLEQVLVVTFTREAVYDLKMRIRKALEQALNALKNKQGPDYLMAVIEQGEEKKTEERIRQALFSYDQAQIFTIHSFCSRILRECAFESDIGEEAITDDQQVEDKYLTAVIRDFFRTSLHADFISPVQLEIVLRKHCNEIESLEKSLLKYAAGGCTVETTRPFSSLFDQFAGFMSQLRLNRSMLMEDYDLLENSYKKMKDSREKVERFANLFEKEISKEDFDLLIRDGLFLTKFFDPSNLKVKAQLPSREKLHYPNLVTLLEKELQPLVEEARSYPMIFSRLAAGCQQMIRNYLETEEKFRFDDLLKKVLHASENASFASHIQQCYPAVIIDEFQDTDPIQWEIFRRLFHKKSMLYLVGDPKQSIYAFRQADIYTYLDAAKTLGVEHHASLDTNFRSQSSLVRALNALFKQSTDWMTLPRLQSALPYPEVKASNKIAESSYPDALHFFICEEDKKTDSETTYFFPYIRQEIGLLETPLSKIAVLVKDHWQADRLSSYLESQGISCSLQRTQSLLDSVAYPSWKELLQAVIFPRDESAVKKALGGPFLAWPCEAVLKLGDPTALTQVLAHFYQLRGILFKDGLASFYEQFLRSHWNDAPLSIAEEILSRENGEEFYRDSQHIAELLIEEEVRTQANPEALLRFLDTFHELDVSQEESLKKRRDHNQEGVRILTIHSSKGLEFDVVFALGLVNRTPREELLIPHGQKLVPLFGTDTSFYHSHLKELDAEKMRQLYVAMTRAKHRLYVPVLYATKPPEQGTASSMELFLESFGNKDVLLQFVENHPEIGHTLLNETQFHFKAIEKSESISLKAPSECQLMHDTQYFYSFTSLTQSLIQEEFSGIQAPHDFKNAEKTVHTLPSGALTGVLIHEIFETLPFDALNDIAILRLHIQHHVAGSLFEEWQDVLLQMIQNTVEADLNGFCFKDIQPNQIYRETEFLYPYHNGFMKGVIDFAFTYQGKYFLVDWKSNWLGPQGTDYAQTKLQASMKKHQYFLQAKIYEDAFKRYLQLIDPRPFEECFGGTFYLFVRGMDPLNKGYGVYYGVG